MLILRALRFELLQQLRSLRFRFGAVLCLALPIVAPYGVYYLIQPHVQQTFGASTYFTIVLDSLRFPTAILAMVVAGHRADLDGLRQMWSVLSSAGIGNFGYLARRCFAQGILVSGLCLLPFLTVLGVLAIAQVPLADPWRPIGSWLLFILPTAFVFVFLWSSLTHITGTELGSLMILLFGNGAAGYILKTFIQPILGTKLVIRMDWMGFENFQYFLLRLSWMIRDIDNFNAYRGCLATDAPFSLELAGQRWMASIALYLGLCAVVFPLSTFLLRRTRKDLSPLVLSEGHQLRNFLGYIHKIRQRYAIDGALHWERYLVLAGLLCCIASVKFIHDREARFSSLAAEQYKAETQLEGFPPTPPEIRFSEWHIEGTIFPRSLEARATGLLKHSGDRAVDRLSFSLNRFLDVDAEVEGRSVSVKRRWNRLVLILEPALQPGEQMSIVFRITGRPALPEYKIYGRDIDDSFATRYEAELTQTGSSWRNDLSQSKWNPLISRRGIDLSSDDLVPVLRYGTWQLTEKPVLEGERGYEVPAPGARPLLDLSVDLSVPEGWFVGDSCGNSSHGSNRMVGKCTDALSRYRVAGGLHRVAQADQQVVAVAFPGHEALMARQFDSIQSVIALSGEAWPGVPPVERLVVVEQAPKLNTFRPTEGFWHSNRKFEAHGRLLMLREFVAVQDRPLAPEQIVSDVMARALLQRRELEPKQTWIFEKLFAALMMRRMGIAGQAGSATITGAAFNETGAGASVLELDYVHPYVALKKIPALSAYLESLVGVDRLYAGIEDFLNRETVDAGTVEELIADLEHRSGISLKSFYDHYLKGRSLPKLELEDVESTATPDGRWRLTGALRNTGTGEVSCPIIAKAEGQRFQERVTVAGDSATGFRFDFDFPPHTVQLDPEDTCYRWVTLGRLKLERVSLIAGQ